MTDQLEQLFAEARAEAIQEIRPAGPTAARQTVRRRRTTNSVIAAVAVVTAIGGTALAVRSPSRVPPATVDLAALEDTAHEKLAANDPATPAVDVDSPVLAGFSRREGVYLGNLTLRVICVGTGRITLVVDGTPDAATGETTPVEQTRVTATCGADPVAVSATFAYSEAVSGLVMRLTDEDSAVGRASFAYRVTSDTGDYPRRPGDPQADPSRVMPADTDGGAYLPAIEPRQPAGKPVPAAGSYRIAVACAGTGTLKVSVQRNDVATASFTAKCQWPPVRTEFAVGHVDAGSVAVLTFISAEPAPGRVAMAWVKQ